MSELHPGDEAPDFTTKDEQGRTVSLGDFAGRKLVVYFYPKAFTPGCTTESCDFRDRYELLAQAGYEILGISPDRPETLAKFRDEHQLPFPLLSDPDHTIADAYGAWGLKKNYGREYEGIIRSTILIEDGTVANAWYNVRASGHAERVTTSITS